MTKHTVLSKISLPLLSLAALLALAPVEVAAQGFDLPPAPTPSSSPVYGPQDTTRPRPIPIPPPSARPTPQPTPSATPGQTPSPQPTATRTPAPQQAPVVRQTQTARTTRPSTQEQPVRPTPSQTAPAPAVSEPSPSPLDLPGVASSPAPAAPGAETSASSQPQTASADGSGLPWRWIALAALLAALAGAYVWWRKRETSGPLSVPQIERPEPVAKSTATGPATARPLTDSPSAPAKVAALPGAAPPPARIEAVSFSHGPLHVAFETRNLTVTMMAATLAYRITLSNRGEAPLEKIMVGGIIEAANDRVAIERQLEPPLGQLPISHQLDTLAAGAVHELTGEIRVPLAQLTPILRGEARLFVPIARLRAAGTPAGGQILVAQRSVLLGIPGQGAQLAPVRLDAGPRVYREIGQQVAVSRAA